MMMPSSLNQLHAIVDPGAASWWPLPSATLIAFLVAVSALTLLLFWQVRRWRSRQARQWAKRQLRDLDPISVGAITQILKRTALAYYPRQRIAEKHGENWMHFLLAALSPKERARYNTLPEQAPQQFYGVTSTNFTQQYYELALVWLNKNLSKQPGATDV